LNNQSTKINPHYNQSQLASKVTLIDKDDFLAAQTKQSKSMK